MFKLFSLFMITVAILATWGVIEVRSENLINSNASITSATPDPNIQDNQVVITHQYQSTPGNGSTNKIDSSKTLESDKEIKTSKRLFRTGANNLNYYLLIVTIICSILLISTIVAESKGDNI